MRVGFIVNAEFPSTVRVVRDRNAQIEVGDILKVESNGKTYLIRIYNVRHEREANKAVIRGLMKDREEAKAIAARESSEVFEGVLLGESIGNSFKLPRTIPKIYSPVYLPSEEDLKALNLTLNFEIPIGTLRARGIENIEVKLSKTQFATHLGVYAMTGKGKTNAVLVILYSILTKLPEGDVGVLVLDVHNEYYEGSSKIAGLKHLESLEDYRNRIIHYDFKKSDIHKKISLPKLYPSEIRSILELTEAQYEALLAFKQNYGDKWFEAVENHREQISSGTKWSETDAHKLGIKIGCFLALYRKLSLLKSCEKLVTTNIEEGLPKEVVEHLDKGRIVIVNLNNLNDLEERLIVNVLSSRILSDREKLQSINPQALTEKPYCLIVLEEAHKVLGEAVLKKGENIFSRIVREGRKFKVGLVAIAQMPRLLDPTIASQIQTSIILGLSHKLDRKVVEESSTQDLSVYDSEIQVLERGEALVVYPSELSFPLPVKIYDFNKLVENLVKETEEKLRGKEDDGLVEVMI